MDNFEGVKIVVMGLARSGEAAAGMLSNMGAEVLVSDQKSEGELKERIDRLKSEHSGIMFCLGGHPEGLLDWANMIVISPGVPSNIPILNHARQRGIPVIGEIELAYRVCKCPVIAITGTKGKSTTSTVLGEILANYRRKNGMGKTIVAGNIGKPITKYVIDLEENDLLVLEVSSFQLETIVYFKPYISVILNITIDHLDRYESKGDYAAAKYRIFENQDAHDYIILNADDPLTLGCVKRTKAKSVLFSTDRKLEQGVFLKKGSIVAKLNNKEIEIMKASELHIPGTHNLNNAMAATGASLVYGADVDSISNNLKKFAGLEHALEFVEQINGVTFINDSKSTNAISLQAALESFPADIVLIIGGRDKGNEYEPVRNLIQNKVSHMVVIGESSDKIINNLGVYAECHRPSTFEEAVKLSYSLAKSGDTVLLSPACASFDMFQDYAQRGRIFKELVRGLAG
ncbi:UDP-N-acetylmuramoyl-L-alanine--D-glutamate ligase [Candidatus Poribacteria bacterium]|nr:UDP-N-acetylmuramoyl-L-alanine--D-glutamate ligase [Candidatus Poribacteria bacterium]